MYDVRGAFVDGFDNESGKKTNNGAFLTDRVDKADDVNGV